MHMKSRGVGVMADLLLVGVFSGSFFFCSQSSRLIQILVTDFTLKPLQVYKHFAEMLTVKLKKKKDGEGKETEAQIKNILIQGS